MGRGFVRFFPSLFGRKENRRKKILKGNLFYREIRDWFLNDLEILRLIFRLCVVYIARMIISLSLSTPFLVKIGSYQDLLNPNTPIAAKIGHNRLV